LLVPLGDLQFLIKADQHYRHGIYNAGDVSLALLQHRCATRDTIFQCGFDVGERTIGANGTPVGANQKCQHDDQYQNQYAGGGIRHILPFGAAVLLPKYRKNISADARAGECQCTKKQELSHWEDLIAAKAISRKVIRRKLPIKCAILLDPPTKGTDASEPCGQTAIACL